jgi:hypothetical protein
MIDRNTILRATVDLEHGHPDMTVEDASSLPGSLGGFAEIQRGKVSRIVVPSGKTAYERTVRLHELIHAQRQPKPSRAEAKRMTSAAYQAVADALVHTVDWPSALPRQANRDALATALTDLRHCKDLVRAAAMGDCGSWNRLVCSCLRSLAILRTANHASTNRGANFCDARGRAYDLLDKMTGGVNLRRALRSVLDTVAQCHPSTARRRRGRLPSLAKRRAKYQAEAEKQLETLFRYPPPAEGEPSLPDKLPGGRLPGGRTRADTLFTIVELPRTVETDPHNRGERAASAGARIIPSRLARSVANNSTRGLFRRRVRLQGGSVLIDASGSMYPSQEVLIRLCLAAPAATVAYYDGDGTRGTLHIYALDGTRYDGETIPLVGGGNDVDLPALQWLLRQAAEPRFFVTDEEFCGGRAGEAQSAHCLLDGAKMTGAVKVIPSLEEAIALFTTMTADEE